MTRIDRQIRDLHRRLVELGLSGFSIEKSVILNHVRITAGESVYHVNPDYVMDALEGFDNLDGTDSEDFIDEIWSVVRANDVCNL